MPSLYKRSNGIYYLAFSDARRCPTRKHVSTRATTKRAAERVVFDLERGRLLGAYDPWRDDPRAYLARRTDAARAPLPAYSGDGAPPDRACIGRCTEAFLATRSNLSPYTRERYRSVAERLAAHVGPDTPAHAVGPAVVQAFIESTETKAVTRHSYRRALRTLFRWMVERGDVEADPTLRLRLERAPSKYPRFLTPSDVEAVCAAVEAHHGKPHVEDGTGLWLLPIVRANVYLGLRAGELVNVRWSDVDLARRTLDVRSTETFTTKGGRDRTLPLCEAVRAVLGGIERRAQFVFPNHSGGQLHRQYLSRRFKRFARLASLPEHVNFHTTRHTTASWLAQQGASIEAIRLYMGHSSVSVTQRYMHLSPDGFAEQIGAAFGRMAA